jgi:hypothetical protein
VVSRREQVLVGFRCDPELREQLELALRGTPMSQFLREAVIEKLATILGPLDPRLAKAPSRLGKGGPKPRKVQLLIAAEAPDSPPVTEKRINAVRYSKRPPPKGPKK